MRWRGWPSPIPNAPPGDEAYSIVKQKIPQILSHWKITADITYQEESHKMHASGKGFTMDLTFEEKQVIAEMTLSLLLSPLKGTILPSLEKEFTKHL